MEIWKKTAILDLGVLVPSAETVKYSAHVMEIITCFDEPTTLDKQKHLNPHPHHI